MQDSFVFRLKKAAVTFVRVLKTDPNQRPWTGNKFICAVCSTKLEYFDPIKEDILFAYDHFKYEYPLYVHETFNVYQWTCPACGARDRERLYAMYYDKIFGSYKGKEKISMIDFAPRPMFTDYFKKFPFLNYRTADLFMDNVDDKVDITNMPLYKDNSIDNFVCSHMLEHVDDDKKAMKELYRILKPGGWGITMAPICLTNDHIIEDMVINSEADRWKYYGQGDHMRFYNKAGFIQRLQDAGFKVNQLGIDYFGAEAFEKNGITDRSVLYVVEKVK
jgi:SAM-dependent methyltransferase